MPRTRTAILLAVAAALWPSPAQGRTAAFTGSGTSDWKGHRCGENYCAQGNILTGPEVVQAMTASFESSSGMLADRLLAALDAAQPAGGDARGMQCAALDALRKAVELNPATRRQLPRNPNFEPLRGDPEFKRLIGQP